MADNNDLRPVIEYTAVKNYEARMMAIAAKLAKMGVTDTAIAVERDKVGLDKGVQKLLHNLGVTASANAKKTERAMVGHGRSGYVPTGNLMKSIASHDDGLTTRVYPSAKAKDGVTEYGGFVEYGTRLHPVPEPYMQDTNAMMTGEIERQLRDLMSAFGGK
jgi:hypothetical protein